MQENLPLSSLLDFQPKQQYALERLLDPQVGYLLYGGAAGGGKSRWLRWSPLALGLYYVGKFGVRDFPIGLFSEDYPTLRDRQIFKIAQEFPSWLGTLHDSQRFGLSFSVAQRFGGFHILLRNLDDPSKYSSVEFPAVFVEELTKNKRGTFDALRFRMRYPGIPETKFAAATNPGDIGHGWVKRLWVEPDPNDPEKDKEQDRFLFVPARYSDNKYISEDYANKLDALPEKMRRAYKDGDWNMFEGQYFTEFRKDLHTIKPFIPSSKLTHFGGIDWGYSPHYFAFYKAALMKVKFNDGFFNRVIIYDEYYGGRKDPKEWTDEIVKRTDLRIFKDVQADPSMWTPAKDGSTSIADLFKLADSEWGRLLQPGSNDRIGGWVNVHNWLKLAPDGLGYLLITENCRNLIRTLPELVHDDAKPEDVNSDGDDDAGDAGRYLLKTPWLKWIDAHHGLIKTRDSVRPVTSPSRKKYIDPTKAPDLRKFEKVPKRTRDWREVG